MSLETSKFSPLFSQLEISWKIFCARKFPRFFNPRGNGVDVIEWVHSTLLCNSHYNLLIIKWINWKNELTRRCLPARSCRWREILSWCHDKMWRFVNNSGFLEFYLFKRILHKAYHKLHALSTLTRKPVWGKSTHVTFAHLKQIFFALVCLERQKKLLTKTLEKNMKSFWKKAYKSSN